MSYDDEVLLRRLREAVEELNERAGRDALAHDKIVALARFTDYIMGLTQPVGTPPSVASPHAATLTCPHCTGAVTVTLS
jgi:hypothetical protein